MQEQKQNFFYCYLKLGKALMLVYNTKVGANINTMKMNFLLNFDFLQEFFNLQDYWETKKIC